MPFPMPKTLRTSGTDGTVTLTFHATPTIGWAYGYTTPRLDDADPRGHIGDGGGPVREHALGPAADLVGVHHVWTVAADRLANAPATGTLTFTWTQTLPGGESVEIGRVVVSFRFTATTARIVKGDGVRFKAGR